MNETMIEKWNDKVGENVIVIHLGNFAWSVNDADDVIDKLNGTILFALGEKDQAIAMLRKNIESSAPGVKTRVEDSIKKIQGSKFFNKPVAKLTQSR